MKVFKYYFTILFVSIICNTFAQQKEFTVRMVTTGARKISPEHLEQVSWRPETNSYVYYRSNDSSLVEEYLDSTLSEKLLTLSELSSIYHESVKSDLAKFPEINWSSKDTFKFWKGDSLWEFNLTSRKLKLITSTKSEAQNKDISSKNIVAYTVDNNLYISLDNRQIAVTNNKNNAIVNGQFVARNEFGIDKGTFWSPNSNFLAFYRKDQTMVSDYPLVDINYRPAKVENIKYPMAGMASEQVTLGIYNIKTNETLFLKTGQPKDHYLTGITWDPSEKYIYAGILNRDQNDLCEIKYDISSGDPIDTLFHETNPKYVQPMHGPIFVKGHPDEFVWFSKRDGWNHLYLYNTNGKLIKKLTEGSWDVTDFEGFDKNGDNIYYTSTEESPLDRQFYMTNIKSGKKIQITNQAGTHRVIKDEGGKYFIDIFTSLDVPYKAEIINENGKNIKNIFTSQNPLKDYKLGKTKIFKLKSDDGYDLYCRMILPFDFDSTKIYPVLVYVYGGPGIQLIKNNWLGGAGLWLNYMASHGYVVFTLDNRGSANRGLDFEQVTFRHLGTEELKDQVIGVNFLKSLPYIDTTKMGLYGWSFGGFMTTSLMTREPGLFQVAVAGGPVIDWSYYEVMYTERYMDTPQANPDGFNKSSLLNYIQNLKGRLLLIHGTSDPIVVWQNDLMFIKKAEDLGIPVDYFVYPGQEHNIKGIDTYHLYDKITNYFKQNLLNSN